MQGICKFKDTQFKLKKKKMRRHVIKESRLFFEIQGQSHSILQAYQKVKANPYGVTYYAVYYGPMKKMKHFCIMDNDATIQ